MKRSMLSAAILGTIGLSATFSVLAVNYPVELCAGAFEKTLSVQSDPSQIPIPMWGYAMGGSTNGVCDSAPSTPGPRITIPDTFNSSAVTGLTITLNNTLPRPTSLVIPGTVKGMSPVYFTPDGGSLMRVRSFDAEASANNGQVTYTWNNFKPGTYMYHSGTHPQVQVEMGLFGAVTDDVVEGSEAYPGITYNQDIVLFYSEIDRSIHDDVANNNGYNFDAPGSAGYMQSTIDYAPKYHLIEIDRPSLANGPVTYEYNDLPTLKLPFDFNPLVRFLNAGQKTHVPTVYGASFDTLAEDGKPSPNVRNQYTLALPPLKTRDTVLNVNGTGFFRPRSFRLTDSAMAVSNPGSSFFTPVLTLDENTEIANGDGNGMVLNIEVAAKPGYVASVPSAAAPVTLNDRLTVQEGGSINYILSKAKSNDSNADGAVASVLSHPSQGQLVNSGGAYRYEHNGGENSQDSLVYALTNAAGETSSASVIIDVAPVNDPPQANDDSVKSSVGKTVEIRALLNDEDVDSPRLVISEVGTSALGSLTAQDQVIIFEPTTEGAEEVTYSISDTSGGSASAVLSLNVTAAASGSGTYSGGSGSSGSGTSTVSSLEALDDNFSVREGETLDITGSTILSVMANDSPGARVNTSLVGYPEHGTLQMFENGTFIYTHDGSEDDDDRFIYEIYTDSSAAKAEVEIKIMPKMDPPHVNNDRANTTADTAILIDVLRNDKDTDSALDPEKMDINVQPEHGTVEVVTQGHVRYTPDPGYRGKDSFRYRLRDAVTNEPSKRSAKVNVRIR